MKLDVSNLKVFKHKGDHSLKILMTDENKRHLPNWIRLTTDSSNDTSENKCILGDCLEKMKDIPDNCIDMILTDLPYGVTARNKWDIIISMDKLWEQWNRIKKEKTPIVLTSSQPFTSKLVMSNLNEFKYEWIWEKNMGSNFANTKRQPMKEHESILIFGDNITYNPIKQIRTESGLKRSKSKFKWNSDSDVYAGKFKKIEGFIDKLRVPRSIQKFNVERGLHPTQKPVLLFEYLIKTYTNEGDTVLDCCAGSGTTAIACLNTNRKYICIEKEPKYFEIMTKRISEHQSKLEVFS